MNYHDHEYEIARDPSHPSHLMPTIEQSATAILDVGCGAGQTLAAISLSSPWVKHFDGFDHDADAIGYGTKRWPFLSLRVGTEKFLPYRDGSYDVVLSRVALPYMDIPRALDEMARVLKPGGQLWIALHTWPYVRTRLWTAISGGQFKYVLLLSYAAVNGLLFHWFGKIVAIGMHCESWQSVSRMQRLLWERGFVVDAIEDKGTVVVMTATKEQ